MLPANIQWFTRFVFNHVDDTGIAGKPANGFNGQVTLAALVLQGRLVHMHNQPIMIRGAGGFFLLFQ